MSDSPAISIAFYDDIKATFLLMVVSIVILGICIANAIDFRNVAIQNDAIPTTYFSIINANILAIVNWVIVGISAAIFLYCFYRVVNRNKILTKIQNDLNLNAIAVANFTAKGIVNTPSKHSENATVKELLEIAKLTGKSIDPSLKGATSCSDGNSNLLCPPQMTKDFALNKLYSDIMSGK